MQKRTPLLAGLLICLLALMPMAAHASLSTNATAYTTDDTAEPLVVRGIMTMEEEALRAALDARGLENARLPQWESLGIKSIMCYAREMWQFDTVKAAESFLGVPMVWVAGAEEGYATWIDIPEALFDDCPAMQIYCEDAEGQGLHFTIVLGFDELTMMAEQTGLPSGLTTTSDSGFVIASHRGAVGSMEPDYVTFIAEEDMHMLEGGETPKDEPIIYMLQSSQIPLETLQALIETM